MPPDMTTCLRCGGTGQTIEWINSENPDRPIYDFVNCTDCFSGFVVDKYCPNIKHHGAFDAIDKAIDALFILKREIQTTQINTGKKRRKNHDNASNAIRTKKPR